MLTSHVEGFGVVSRLLYFAGKSFNRFPGVSVEGFLHALRLAIDRAIVYDEPTRENFKPHQCQRDHPTKETLSGPNESVDGPLWSSDRIM